MSTSGSLNHLSLSCSDIAKSRKFYDFFLGQELKYKTIMDEPYCVMYAHSSGAMICISPGNQTPHHKNNPGIHHLALNISSDAEIDHFHEKLVQYYKANSGSGHILDAPAFYPQYAKHYYAVFFTDPDGIKLELVHNKGY
ncbi:hypothetical protein BGZ94_006705 [Podila epigama]|nr:hypothetical protein BGZ94_006705 [Podila epigama]